MCEGGATLQAVMFENVAGLTHALENIKFHIHIAPWTTPLSRPNMLSIPTLVISGHHDIEPFPEMLSQYKKNFSGFYSVCMHNGGHNYPRVTSSVKSKILELLTAAYPPQSMNASTEQWAV